MDNYGERLEVMYEGDEMGNEDVKEILLQILVKRSVSWKP